MFKKMKRRCITLVEIMIVMLLITVIISVIGYNYVGSLDEGRAFKTKAGIERLRTILNIRAAEDPGSLDNIGREWEEYVKQSPLVQNPAALTQDGWGERYQVDVQDGQIMINSKKYDEYKRTHRTLFSDEK